MRQKIPRVREDGEIITSLTAKNAKKDNNLVFFYSSPLNTPPLAAGMKADMFPLLGEGKLKKGWES